VLASDGSAHWLPGRADWPPLRGLTCGALLDTAATAWPEREALVYCAYDEPALNVRWTFRELRERSLSVAGALAGAGVAPGERVALWATNLPEWFLVQFGCAYAGVVLVPLNPLYRAPEVAHVLRTAEVGMLLVEPHARGSSLWELALEAAADAPSVRRVVAIREDAWTELLADGGETPLPEVESGDIAQIQFTSGTTGAPKGAMLRHGALTDNARLFARRAELASGGVICSGMPQFHCGGSVLATLGSIATGSALMPLVRFDARKAIDSVDTELAGALCAVPTMLLAIEGELASGGGSLASLERIVTGGSLVPPEIARRWYERLGVTFSITYGLTEASPVITQSSPSDPFELQVSTVGVPLPHVECDVAGADGRRVRVGEEGEVRVRGWQVMAGYFGDSRATEDAVAAGGWLRTGDLARLDEDGYLRITGRAKDMIIRGGENIYPAEIEHALCALDGVLDACVVGVPDERYGEVPAAFVRVAEGASVDAEAMRSALAGRLARFKIPAHLRVVDEFPLTASGKIQRFRLREIFLATPVT
jgi:acyl-CoA synthetase (AMP-forming)/AMP-acid ligase II